MKKINYLIALFIISIATLSSCKKEDNSSSNTTPSSTASISSVITSGTWHVSYYHHGSDDSTTSFSSYTFTFSSGGTMTGVNTSGSTNGTWSKDDSHNELHISIGSSSPLSDLSSGWTIISYTSTEIKLKDDSSSEEVHFLKN